MSDEKTTNPAPVTMVEVVDIQFRPGQKVYYFDPAGLTCKQGDHVIMFLTDKKFVPDVERLFQPSPFFL